MRKAARVTRRVLDVALIALVVSVLGLVLAANFGPAVGHELVVIRGSSMTPSIPLGSVVDIVHVQPADLRPGDVVTLKEPTGGVVTHRIVSIAQLKDGTYIETKGDANDKADAPAVPISWVWGRVEMSVPLLGFLLYMLTIPTGVLSIFSFAFTLLLMIWLLEEIEQDEEETVATEPVLDPEVSPAGLAS